MSKYSRSILILGIMIPAVFTTAILIGCYMGFSHFHRTLKKNFKIYTSINACKQQLQSAEEEARFLSAEMSNLENTQQFDEIISLIETATASEKSVKWLGAESPASDQRVLSFEGLSGPMVPIIGDVFRKTPTLLVESWNIKKSADEKKLVFTIKTVLPTTEADSGSESGTGTGSGAEPEPNE